jgi:hypothetical protein
VRQWHVPQVYRGRSSSVAVQPEQGCWLALLAELDVQITLRKGCDGRRERQCKQSHLSHRETLQLMSFRIAACQHKRYQQSSRMEQRKT